MKTTTATLGAILAASGFAHAGDNTITQSLDYEWNESSGFQVGTFDAFDDAGGTRELVGVSVDVDGSLEIGVEALNFSSFALESGEWSAEGIISVNLLLGDFGPGSIEQALGSAGFAGLTGELGAGSGSPFGEPGTPTVTDTLFGALSASFGIGSSDFVAFTDGAVTANLLSFSDLAISNGPPGSIISVRTDSVESFGSIDLTYTYRVVPAPTTVAGLLGAALFGARRRR